MDKSYKPRNQRIFVAGATGAIGRRLCPMLVEDGWQVFGTTRYQEKKPSLSAMGVEAVVVDVFDEQRLRDALGVVRPSIVIHQLTDLPPGLDPERMNEGRQRTARLRDIGTRHLIAAASACGVERMVVQSIAFAYELGPKPYLEESPLDNESISRFEHQVTHAPFPAVLLRYGRLYGPGTGFETPSAHGSVHVDAAADAARRATTEGIPGIYNVAEDDGMVSIDKAKRGLGWAPELRFIAAR
jgi:nucleoside-diphosphate-sugar epimerase